MKNKHHWYDGFFYDKFIAPNQDEIFDVIKSLISEESRVLDFGCGTGRLPLALSDKCSFITGIDLSIKNISVALDNARQKDITNVEFIHGGIEDLPAETIFDYSTLSFVIHEIPPVERVNILKGLKEVSEKLIISDYSVNRSLKNKVLNEVVEFAAGRDHYQNYKNYLAQGGIEALLTEAGYQFKMIEKGIGFSSDIYLAEPVSGT